MKTKTTRSRISKRPGNVLVSGGFKHHMGDDKGPYLQVRGCLHSISGGMKSAARSWIVSLREALFEAIECAS